MNRPVAPATLPTPDATGGGGRAKIFVSYSRRDLGFAQWLVAELVALGFEAFLDKTDIAPGEPWQERLAALIASADTVVFVVSPASAASTICAWELDESARLNKRVLPLVARMVPDADVPAALGRLNFIFCTETDDRGTALATLERALGTDLPWVREHTRLGEVARRWQDRARAKTATLRGADLDAAERWLDRRPADAILPTQLHQDFIRASRRVAIGRQRTWVVGALVVASVSVGLAVFAEFSRREAQAQRVAAEAAKREAQGQRDRAERALGKANHTAETLIFGLADKFRETTGMPRSLVRGILEPALKLQDDLVAGGETDPLLRRNQSVALNEVGHALQTMGDVEGALAAAEKSRGIMQALTREQPMRVEWRRDLSISSELLGDFRMKAGDQAGALQAYGEQLAIARSLAASQPDAEARRDLAVSLDRIASVKQQAGSRAAALALYNESLAIRRELLSKSPRTQARSDLLVSLGKIGRLELTGGERRKALAHYEESVVVARDLAVDKTSAKAQRDLAIALQGMGDARLRVGDPRGAVAAYQEGLAIQRELAADESNKLAQRDLAIGLDSLGEAMRKSGDRAAALAAYRESLAITRGLATDKKNALVQRDLATSLGRVAGMQQQAGDLAGALAGLAESLALRRTLAADPANAPAQRDLSLGLDKLAAARRQAGDRAGAAAALRESLGVLRSMGAKNPSAGDDFGEVAYELVLSRDFRPALEAADMAIAAASDQLGYHANRAHALMFLGRTDEARAIYLAHRGRLADGKKSWRAMILQDFAEMRDAGLGDPLMGEIETTLSADAR